MGIRVRALGLRVRLVDLNFGVSTGLGLRVFEQHCCLLLSYLGRPNGVLSNNSLFWGDGRIQRAEEVSISAGAWATPQVHQSIGRGVDVFRIIERYCGPLLVLSPVGDLLVTSSGDPKTDPNLSKEPATVDFAPTSRLWVQGLRL